MSERAVIIGNFDSARDWGLILNKNQLSAPEPQTETVSVPGLDGDLDFTEALTGDVRYKNRTWSGTFLMTEGTVTEREQLMAAIRNYLHGKRHPFILPDDPDKYLEGRFKITSESHNVAFSAFSVEADCKPYRYFLRPYRRALSLSSTLKAISLTNHGTKTVRAEITATNALIVLDGVEYEYKNGKKPPVKVTAGDHILKASGSGSFIITYTEGVL